MHPIPPHRLRRCILLAATLVGPPASRAYAQRVDDSRPASLETGVDPSIAPGDDFFAFANGAWLRTTAIPAGRESWTARTEIDELTRGQVARLLEDAATQPEGSLARKVADFRAAWANDAAIEARGIAPLRPLLDTIDRVRDRAALTRLLGRRLGADVDPLNWGVYRSSRLLGLAVEPSIHGERANVAFLVQGGLGLPDREHYLGIGPRMDSVRAVYRAYVGRMLALAGFDRVETRAAAVLALETALARGQATREASANDRNADTVWTASDFAREAPGMDWRTFFAAAGLAREPAFVPWQPGAMRSLSTLIASAPLDAWKDYLRFHVIHEHADVLPRAFVERALALRGLVSGQPPSPARSQRALDATQLTLSDAIGRLYAERHFPPERKARVRGIVDEVVAAFARRVERAAWMSPATRALALTKLRKLYVGIGYPDRWEDYSDLTVDPADAFGNHRRVTDRAYRRALARLGRPVDPAEWWMPAQRVGAILVFQQNAYDFTAALLQSPKFDSDASDAAAYGAIGAIIGHDVTHFIDALGSEYDTAGAMRRWWTAEDSARYQARAVPLAEQFSAYRPLPELAVNGRMTATENIADLAGLAAAFDAYRATVTGRAADRDYVRSQDRAFFIGFARSWRSKTTDAALRTQLTTDNHAPDRYRVATVRNLDAWYDAFDVRPEARLYLDPGSRVRIW